MHADDLDADPEPYRPRPEDHLVEPMFGGLGVGEEHREPAELSPQHSEGPPAWWQRILARLFPPRD